MIHVPLKFVPPNPVDITPAMVMIWSKRGGTLLSEILVVYSLVTYLWFGLSELTLNEQLIFFSVEQQTIVKTLYHPKFSPASYNGLSPVRHQAINWTDHTDLYRPYRLIVNWTLRNKFQWNLNRNSNIFIQENPLEMSSAKWRPFCPGGDEFLCQWRPMGQYPNHIKNQGTPSGVNQYCIIMPWNIHDICEMSRIIFQSNYNPTTLHA